MERVDGTLEGIVERLERIEDRINRPKVLFYSGVSAIGVRVVIITLSITLAYLAALLGLGYDLLSPIGL